jgi:N-acetylglucosamine malate deacetylase 1
MMPRQILVIAAHPDDEVLGCGGTIARHVAEGDSVSVAVVTRGAPEVFPPSQVEQVRRELAAAHQVLDIPTVHFLDLPAPKLDTIPQYKIAGAIQELVQRVQPEIVYMPHHGDLHGDHRAVFHATLVATRPIQSWRVKRLLSYETLSETEWASPFADQVFIPTVFVDIHSYLDRKLRAMECYASQLKEPPHPRSLRGLTALAQLRGAAAGLDAAEAFCLVREIS